MANRSSSSSKPVTKRPPNAFLLFRKERSKTYMLKEKGSDFNDQIQLSKELGAEWRHLSVGEQGVWRDKYRDLLDAYQKTTPPPMPLRRSTSTRIEPPSNKAPATSAKKLSRSYSMPAAKIMPESNEYHPYQQPSPGLDLPPLEFDPEVYLAPWADVLDFPMEEPPRLDRWQHTSRIDEALNGALSCIDATFVEACMFDASGFP